MAISDPVLSHASVVPETEDVQVLEEKRKAKEAARQTSFKQLLASLLAIYRIIEAERCQAGSCTFCLCYQNTNRTWYFMVYSPDLDVCYAQRIFLEDEADKLDPVSGQDLTPVRRAYQDVKRRWLISHRISPQLISATCSTTCRQIGVQQ